MSLIIFWIQPNNHCGLIMQPLISRTLSRKLLINVDNLNDGIAMSYTLMARHKLSIDIDLQRGLLSMTSVTLGPLLFLRSSMATLGINHLVYSFSGGRAKLSCMKKKLHTTLELLGLGQMGQRLRPFSGQDFGVWPGMTGVLLSSSATHVSLVIRPRAEWPRYEMGHRFDISEPHFKPLLPVFQGTILR